MTQFIDKQPQETGNDLDSTTKDTIWLHCFWDPNIPNICTKQTTVAFTQNTNQVFCGGETVSWRYLCLSRKLDPGQNNDCFQQTLPLETVWL